MHRDLNFLGCASLLALACSSTGSEREPSPSEGPGGILEPSSGGSTSNDTASGGSSSGGTASGGVQSASGGNGAGGNNAPQAGGSGAPTGGAAGSNADDDGPCPFSGAIEYQLNGADGWPSDVVELLTAAMDEAIFYYNCYADLQKSLTVNYDEGVPTAQANIDGWISFGSNRGFMQVATAMHEIAHTLGVGFFPWTELMDDGLWTGPAVVELMSNLPADQRDLDEFSQRTYIRGDSQHFWPYGLNQASEHQSEWSLINHVRIVAKVQEDKQAYLAGEL